MGTTAEKLTYLNTTKGKIKDSINLTGAGITTEPFRQYAVKLKDAYVDIINNGTDTLYNNFPKVSGSGTDLSLQNTYEAPIQSTLKGNTSQVQLSGKNIIASFRESTANRINYNLDTNGLTTTMVLSLISNTSVSNVTVYLRTITDAGVYTMGNISLVANTRVSFSFTLTTTQINTLKSTDSVLQLYKGSSGLSGVSLSEVQIENGTTATTYEQYCGGIPSPNPSYPQDIHNVSGNNSVVVCGKNLFDKNNPYLINGYVNYLTGSFSAQSSSNQKCLVIRVKPNTKYTWSGYSTTATLGYGLFTTIPNVNDASNHYGRISDTKTITTGENDNYLVMFHSATNASVDFTQFQVEQSETATTYEAYNGTTYPINLPSGMELSKIGTYQDYIYKDSDKWYLHKEIGKMVLNGTQPIGNINTSLENTVRITYLSIINGLSSILLLCNRLQRLNMFNIDSEGIYYNATNGNLFFRMNKSTIGTTENAINTYLQSNNIIMYYPLATPTNTEITDTTLLSQLEAIYNAKSKNGTTNINQENNDLGFIITASALEKEV